MPIRSAAASERRLVASSGVFDSAWYSARIPASEQSRDPLGHFMVRGWRRGLDPSPHFDIAYYRDQAPDLAELGINPLVHYLKGGWRFGLRPTRGFQEPPESDWNQAVCPLVLSLALEHADRSVVDHSVTGTHWPTVTEKRLTPAYERPSAPAVTAVAFYLPQFHTIPENDRWWGKGFTEWTNVRRGIPQYQGHYQPHVPGDLGYYDLAQDPDIMHRQIDLAQRHGVGAFCFYTYWFGGKQLLETPVKRWLEDRTLDFPFCICWANENWTRTWDGKSKKVLIGQRHSPDDDLAFISEMAPYLRDSRYLRISGKPLLVIYRPSELPSPKRTAQLWRDWCRTNEVGEICLAYVQSFDLQDPRHFGFDFAIEFPPHNMATPKVPPRGRSGHFDGRVLDWVSLARRPLQEPGYPLWRGVTPSWDNEARRPGKGMLLLGSDPAPFGKWVERVGRSTVDRYENRDERLIWINAWNEWAEGAHLEPDQRYGYEWLHAVRDAQESVSGVISGTGPGVVVIAHDLQRNGAQLGSLALARMLAALGRRVEIVACGSGPLAEAARQIAPTTIVIDDDVEETAALALDLVQRGFTTALANSSVSGLFARAMRRVGAHVVGLVHELPGVLTDPARSVRAEALTDTAHDLIFPVDTVLNRFPYRIPASTNVHVRPQGRYQPRRPLANATARRELRKFLGIPQKSRVILGVGYGYHRKGLDLLLEAVSQLPSDASGDSVHLIWLGGIDTSDERITRALAAAPDDRVHLPGYEADTGLYYRGADVLALPSREDPFPSVTLEALDVGLPVVAFRERTGQDRIVSDTNGILVDGLAADAFARGLRKALDSEPAGASEIRRQYISDRFSYRRYVLDILALTPAAIPRVSVVVPNFNYGDLIGHRLEQVLAQTFPIYELIVLDDASTDNSLSQIDAALEGSDIPTKVIRNDENSGSVYRQWAKGVAECQGDLVWIAEADDVADPEFLAEAVAPMLDPDVVLSYCESRQIDETGSELAPDYRSWTDLGSRDYTRRYTRSGDDEIRDCLAIKNTIPNASAVVMRLDALRDLFATSGQSIAEEHPTTGDWWIYLQLLRAGKVSFSPRVLNSHRRHSNSVIASGDRASHLREIEAIHAVAANLQTSTTDTIKIQRDFLDTIRDQ